MPQVDHLRSRQDRELAERLQQDPAIQAIQRKIDAQEAEGPSGIRRHLLATSVRLTKGIAPELNQLIQACRDSLELDIELETFVYSSPQFNAACVKPESGRLFVLFSSSLLEAFDADELKFVIGHELGHHLFGHHDVPIGYALKARPSPELALRLFAWSRYAEISADRAGAACVENLSSAATSLFRLASGLKSQRWIQANAEAMLAQLRDMVTEEDESKAHGERADWFSTHPFSPLRVKALELFGASAFKKPGGMSADALEAEVQTIMALMEPSYLEAKTEVAEAMRRVLFAGGLVLAGADQGISEAEIEAFEGFFGEGRYSETLNLEKLEAELPERLAHLNHVASFGKKLQVVRDLAVIAQASGQVEPAECVLLTAWAQTLEIDSGFVARCSLPEPLD